MPSGITSAIYNGEDPSLRDYLMTVGRQYGFAIMQRDEDPSQPVRAVESDTSYYDRSLDAAMDRAIEVYFWTTEEAEVEAQAAFVQETVRFLESKADSFKLWLRYEGMRARVEYGWDCPERMPQVKEGALKHLSESQDFDCRNPSVTDTEGWPGKPTLLTGTQYRLEQLARCRRDIEYAARYRAEEVGRTDDRNLWITEFTESLPDA